jgi:hypothetical protein
MPTLISPAAGGGGAEVDGGGGAAVDVGGALVGGAALEVGGGAAVVLGGAVVVEGVAEAQEKPSSPIIKTRATTRPSNQFNFFISLLSFYDLSVLAGEFGLIVFPRMA